MSWERLLWIYILWIHACFHLSQCNKSACISSLLRSGLSKSISQLKRDEERLSEAVGWGFAPLLLRPKRVRFMVSVRSFTARGGREDEGFTLPWWLGLLKMGSVWCRETRLHFQSRAAVKSNYSDRIVYLIESYLVTGFINDGGKCLLQLYKVPVDDWRILILFVWKAADSN